jgi:hypothetical protein
MERFGNPLRWFIDRWKRWGVPTIVGSALTADTWILARRKEWKEARRAKADSAVDSRVIGDLQNRNLWGPPRPWTGGRFLTSAIWTLFRQGFGVGKLSGSVPFYTPIEVSRQSSR